MTRDELMTRGELIREFSALAQVERMLWKVDSLDKARAELRDRLDHLDHLLERVSGFDREFDQPSPPPVKREAL